MFMCVCVCVHHLPALVAALGAPQAIVAEDDDDDDEDDALPINNDDDGSDTRGVAPTDPFRSLPTPPNEVPPSDVALGLNN